MPSRSFLHAAVTLSAIAGAGFMSGCSTSFTPNPIQTDQVPIGNIQGTLHGGQAPIVGAAVYLYAAGTGGYRTSATSLLQAGGNTVSDGTNYYVTTDASGSFNISGDYTCTSGLQVYLVAVGGDAGSGPNSAIVQMAGLGTCPSDGDLAATVPFVMINEVSTVVFAYAMGGFGSSAYNVSATATALAQTGMTNAMANVSNIMNIGTGTAYTQAKGNANSTVPQAEINTLANILTECVNSSGPTSSQCTSLFADAPDLSGNPATDEATAIFNIVHNPASSAANITALFNLSIKQYIFTPYLPAAPSDWTLPIVYNGLVNTPFNIAFDTSGNAWIGDKVLDEVLKIGPQGAASTYNTNQETGLAFKTIKGLAVAPDGNTIWVTDYDRNEVYIMNSSGTVTQYLTTGLNGPAAVAFGADADGVTGDYTGYVANEEGNGVAGFSANSDGPYGTAESSTSNIAGISEPAWIAVDNHGQVWVPSTTGDDVGEVTAAATTKTKKGVTTTTYTYTSNSYDVYTPSYAVVVDSGNNLWMGNISSPGTLYEGTPQYNGKKGALSGVTVGSSHVNGGLQTPYMASVDGNGTIWVANEESTTGGKTTLTPTVSGWNPTAWNAAAKKDSGNWLEDSTTVGLQTGATASCLAATPDLSGNLWTANSDGSVTQMLGVAAPTAAPLMQGNIGVTP